MKGIESNVDETFSDSRGSFRKTRVIPFAFEKTRMMNPDSRKSESVICSGIVSGAEAARGVGDVKDGVVER